MYSLHEMILSKSGTLQRVRLGAKQRGCLVNVLFVVKRSVDGDYPRKPGQELSCGLQLKFLVSQNRAKPSRV